MDFTCRLIPPARKEGGIQEQDTRSYRGPAAELPAAERRERQQRSGGVESESGLDYVLDWMHLELRGVNSELEIGVRSKSGFFQEGSGSCCNIRGLHKRVQLREIEDINDSSHNNFVNVSKFPILACLNDKAIRQ